jgi:hypothetical protein
MTLDILTKEDLQQFKKELLSELFKSLAITQPQKKWLKSNEVKTILACSSGTLQNLRINGTLNPTKIGGTWYFDSEQVNNLLSQTN